MTVAIFVSATARAQDDHTLVWRGTVPTARVYANGQFVDCFPTIRRELYHGKQTVLRNRAECPASVSNMSDIAIDDGIFANDGGAHHMHRDRRGLIILTR
jgi:hypothetical protein